MHEDEKAYRIIIITSDYGNDLTEYFGPFHLRRARQIKTMTLKMYVGHGINIVDAYIERADNWNRVLDSDKE